MRPISRNTKRTNIVTANITPQLFEQLQAYTLAHHSTLATTIRDALRNYLDHADTIGGPAGRMLQAGAAHLGEPRELIEEVMYEQVLATRLRLNGWLPFVAICATSARCCRT